MSFRAAILQTGKTTTDIVVPAEEVEELSASRRPMVIATINGFSYPATIVLTDGEYMLPVTLEARTGAGVAAGDEVEVDIELDTSPREVVVPADLMAAMEESPRAKQFFDGLTYTNKARFVQAVETAKPGEARQKKIIKSIAMMRERRVS